MQKQFFTDWFGFTRKERTGIIALLAIILFLMLIPFAFPLFIHHATPDHHAFEKEIAALKIEKTDSDDHHKRNYNYNGEAYQPYHQPDEKDFQKTGTKEALFYFDPNTLGEEGWQRLGVKERTVATIKNYLSKGGRFRTAEDIKKIWGMNEALALRIIPYVHIEKIETSNPAYDVNYKPAYEKKNFAPPVIDINTADSSTLIALPGIGSKLAQRIVSFRDKLGGFYKAEQVAETFGLPDSVYQKIKARFTITNTTIKQLNINTAGLDELRNHPYLRYNIAAAIVQYRTQHGNFSSMEDLKKIMLVTDDLLNKVKPYLRL